MAKSRRMYAVSCDGVGLIAGTLAYSRQNAIEHFLGNSKQTWSDSKRAGYRTVLALVEVIDRWGKRHRSNRVK